MTSTTAEAKLQEWMQSCQEFHKTEKRIEKAVQSSIGLSLNEFYLLHHLSAQPKQKFRIQDAAELIRLSQSATSRLVMRLESEDIAAVERRICDIDKRGVYVHLTEAGEQLFNKASEAVSEVL